MAKVGRRVGGGSGKNRRALMRGVVRLVTSSTMNFIRHIRIIRYNEPK